MNEATFDEHDKCVVMIELMLLYQLARQVLISGHHRLPSLS